MNRVYIRVYSSNFRGTFFWHSCPLASNVLKLIEANAFTGHVSLYKTLSSNRYMFLRIELHFRLEQRKVLILFLTTFRCRDALGGEGGGAIYDQCKLHNVLHTYLQYSVHRQLDGNVYVVICTYLMVQLQITTSDYLQNK